MGMFDSIRFENSSMLPKPENFELDLEKLDFQTKSLENALYVYEISEDKFLYKKDELFRENPTNEPVKKHKVDFHGIINFGAYESTDLIDYSIEYEAKFTDGVLQNVKLLEYKTYDHESKKKQREQFIEEYKRKNNKWSSRLIKAINSFFSFPFKLIGFTSISTGIFKSKRNNLLKFYFPKIILGKKNDFRRTIYGLSIDKITTEIKFSKTTIGSSKEFSFKILGIGFEYILFEDFDAIGTYI
jgi:hypothetical protein